MEEIKTVEMEEEQKLDEKKEEEVLPVTIEPNWVDKRYQKYHERRLEKAKRKAEKQKEPKLDKGTKVGLGVGIGLGLAGGLAGVALRRFLFGSSDDTYELGEDSYFSSQLETSEEAEEV